MNTELAPLLCRGIFGLGNDERYAGVSCGYSGVFGRMVQTLMKYMSIQRFLGVAGVLTVLTGMMFLMLHYLQVSPLWFMGMLWIHAGGLTLLLVLSIWKIVLPSLFSLSEKDARVRQHDTETYAVYRIVQQSQQSR